MAKKAAGKKTVNQKMQVQAASYRNPLQEWLADAITEKQGNGVNVTGNNVLGYAPVWSCVNKIAGHIGYLPVHLYERERANPKKVRVYDEHVSYYAIAVEPNQFMTPQTLKESMASDALIYGNGRAWIQRDGNNMATGFIPLPANRTTTIIAQFDENGEVVRTGTIADVPRYPGNWEKWHVVSYGDGGKLYLRDENVLHIPGLTQNGITGYSIVDLARQTLSLGMTAEKAALNHFAKGARPSFFIEAPPGVLTKQGEAEQFLEDMKARHAGEDNEGAIGLLRGGMKASTIQVNARDSQQNEQRLFQRQEVALLFAVEQILGDDSSVSYRSLEEKNRAYITNCLNRWLSKWEQELARKTLTVTQRRSMRYYYRFDDWELTRGTMYERFQAYQIGRQAEILSSNECREWEDLEPRPGGDDYANPAINPQKTTNEPPPSSGDTTAKAIASRISHLVNIERKRVLHYAEKSANFVESVDRFYAGWKDRFAIAVKELGGDEMLANDWTESNQRGLIIASGNATKETLCEIIKKRTESWNESELIENIKELSHV